MERCLFGIGCIHARPWPSWSVRRQPVETLKCLWQAEAGAKRNNAFVRDMMPVLMDYMARNQAAGDIGAVKAAQG